jgi:hypothetical protein
MNSEQKRAIKSTILECREILEKDVEQVLINYGIYVNKDWINVRDLKNLTEEQENNRKRIEAVIEKLQKGGFDKEKAVKEYIKEIAYTYLNRIAALRVMEVRGLIDEILKPRVEYGNRSFIGSRFYEVAREYCKFQVDGGLAYLLNVLFEEISEEIQVLFSTEDEYSFISPSSGVLLKIIELLCNNIDEEAWKQDEIIGWIYQYFNDKEKDDVFDRLYNKKEKIKVEDIPAATQLFTPDWIVKWIVDNSLGTLWQEIKEGKRGGKKVEEIKLLDPCCGSGHFLVKAYDLFYQMYLEEGVYTKEEIPYKILENNIHGIDIDLRAVQLTALILFIKTKTYLKESGCDINTKDKLVVNLVCADAILLNGTRLQALKEEHKNNKTVLKMIDIIYDEFKDVRLKGSLIQPEKKLFPLFEEYKNRIAKNKLNKAKRQKKKQSEGQLSVMDDNVLSLAEFKSASNFTKEEQILMKSLNDIYLESVKANDINKQLFANEAVKSVKLVDIFMKKKGYDVVVTNPPYLWKRNMTEKLKIFVETNYKDWSTDLYSVFIARCLEFLNNEGKLGMITQQSFMFISSYKTIRTKLLENYYIEKMVHLGPRAFDDISGEKVNTVMFIIQNSKAENKKSYFLRLYNGQSANEKRDLLLGKIKKENIEYLINQNQFKKISGEPFVYWLDNYIFKIFEEQPAISKKHKVISGMRIGANDRFLRYYWEIDKNKIGNEWKTYNKGGEFSRFYGDYKYVIDWRQEALNYYKENNAHRNQTMYFKQGVTYTLVTSSGFSVRIIPENAVFDAAGPSIFCSGKKKFYLCGFLNSTLVTYLLNVLNSTINYTPTDTNKLPFKQPTNEIETIVSNLGEVGYKIAKNFYEYVETSLNFKDNLLRKVIINSNIGFNECVKKSLYIKRFLNFIENKLIITIDDLIFNLYKIDGELKEQIINESNYDLYKYKHIYDSINVDYDKIESSMDTLINYYDELAGETRILEVLDTLYPIQNSEGVNEVKELISYYIGVILGRYSKVNDGNGVIPINSSIYLEEDMVKQIYNCLLEDLGDSKVDEVIEEIEIVLGINLETYLINDFYSEHIKKYEKRPVYWHICSPKKTFNCFVYYHKLNEDTLYKVKSIYLGQMIDRYREDLKYYNAQLVEARTNSDKNKENEMKKKCNDLEAKLEDLYDLDQKIMDILPYKPDLDQGVLYNIIPLEPILASKVSTAKEREDYKKEVGK